MTWPVAVRWIAAALATGLIGALISLQFDWLGISDLRVSASGVSQPVGEATSVVSQPDPAPCAPTLSDPSPAPVAESDTVASDAPIEGAIGVANVTRGDTKYSGEVVAEFDDVVKFQVLYNNRLNDGTTIIRGLRLGVDLPHRAGEVQTATATIEWDGDSLADSASVHVRSDMCLAFLQGSVVWRHNTAPTGAEANWEDIVLPDSSLLTGEVPLDNVRPRYEYAGTVTFLARVVVASLTAEVEAGNLSGALSGTNPVIGYPGRTLEVRAVVTADGNAPARGTVLRLVASSDWVLVAGSTRLGALGAPLESEDGFLVSADSLFDDDDGLNLGDLEPGQSEEVRFEIRLAANVEQDIELTFWVDGVGIEPRRAVLRVLHV